MTRTEALNLLREYADCQSQLWSKTPEGQKYMALFNEAVDTIAAERDMTQYWHGRQQTNQ